MCIIIYSINFIYWHFFDDIPAMYADLNLTLPAVAVIQRSAPAGGDQGGHRGLLFPVYCTAQFGGWDEGHECAADCGKRPLIPVPPPPPPALAVLAVFLCVQLAAEVSSCVSA